MAAGAFRYLRSAREAEPSEPGSLRREHLVFRDRCRPVPRAGVLQGTAAEPVSAIYLVAAGFPGLSALRCAGHRSGVHSEVNTGTVHAWI